MHRAAGAGDEAGHELAAVDDGRELREFGRRRDEVWMGGRHWDTLYMDCLASEFVSPVLSKVFVPDMPRG